MAADESKGSTTPRLTPKAAAARTQRDARLAAALRENLKRRKAQERGRPAEGAEATEDEPTR